MALKAENSFIKKMKITLLILAMSFAAPTGRKSLVSWSDMSNWRYQLLKAHQTEEMANTTEADYLVQIKRHLEKSSSTLQKSK